MRAYASAYSNICLILRLCLSVCLYVCTCLSICGSESARLYSCLFGKIRSSKIPGNFPQKKLNTKEYIREKNNHILSYESKIDNHSTVLTHMYYKINNSESQTDWACVRGCVDEYV